jgi:hypothetical protein
MLKRWVFAMALAGALAAIATAQSPPKFLTNDDIVSMVKAGQDVDTVLSAIQTQGTDFDVSAKALLQLKRSGVPKKVIDAMIGAVKDQKEAAAAVLSAAQAKIAAAEAEDKAEEAKAAISELWRAPGMNGSRGSNVLLTYGAGGTDPIFRQIFSFEVVASGMAWW